MKESPQNKHPRKNQRVNRYIMECEVKLMGAGRFFVTGVNRYIMECEVNREQRRGNQKNRVNRYIMECEDST